MCKKVKVVLVEDDLDFIYLFKKMIKKDARLDYLGYATDRISGIDIAERLKPDIVVMDLNLSGYSLDGIDAAKEIRLRVGAKILFLTSYEQSDIVINVSKKTFASGYIFKSQCHALADTIYETATSQTPQECFIKELAMRDLTSAERGVLNDLLTRGNAETSSLSSLKTIANQKTSIFRKLGLKNTSELLRAFSGR